jgi:uncharacterized OsmC-like protein
MSTAVDSEKESMTISWVEGVRLAAQVRNHRVVVDQPIEDGGRDQEINPVEMFVVSLGTCIGYYAVRFFQRHKIPATGFKLAMEWDYAEQPHRIGSISIRADFPEKLEPALKERLQKVMEGCRVHNSMTMAPIVMIQLTASGDGGR